MRCLKVLAMLLLAVGGVAVTGWAAQPDPPADAPPGTGKGHGTLTVLGVTVPDVPLLWREEPYAPVGSWLNALGVRAGADETGLTLTAPTTPPLRWTPTTSALTRNGAAVSVAPLVRDDGALWVPLVSLARVLGLQAIVSPQRSQVKLLATVQRVTLQPVAVGWLLEVGLSYPLLTPPRTGTLTDPYRAYADFVGASVAVPPEALPNGDGPIVGVRVGQFSSDPPVARVVVDAQVPLTISLAGHQMDAAGERWWLLVQPLQRRPWLGQVSVVENSPTRAVLHLRGWFGDLPRLTATPQRLTAEVPATPLLPANVAATEPDGLVRAVTVTPTERGARLVVLLRAPAQGAWRPQPDDSLLLVIEAPARRPSPGRLIVVDPGHGGTDPGASSPFGLPPEKHLTLDIALRLKRLLEQAGYRVYMTRDRDVYISLADRVAVANRLNAEAFVSVHLNSFPRPGGQWGTEVYYWTPQSLPLANAIYRNLLALLGRKGNGVRQRRLYVVRHTTMPSVLVEACYLNHPEEAALLRDEQFRERIALAIYRGIAEFFGDLRRLERAPVELPPEREMSGR